MFLQLTEKIILDKSSEELIELISQATDITSKRTDALLNYSPSKEFTSRLQYIKSSLKIINEMMDDSNDFKQLSLFESHLEVERMETIINSNIRTIDAISTDVSRILMLVQELKEG